MLLRRYTSRVKSCLRSVKDEYRDSLRRDIISGLFIQRAAAVELTLRINVWIKNSELNETDNSSASSEPFDILRFPGPCLGGSEYTQD
jgi:hypothetical protein